MDIKAPFRKCLFSVAEGNICGAKLKFDTMDEVVSELDVRKESNKSRRFERHFADQFHINNTTITTRTIALTKKKTMHNKKQDRRKMAWLEEH